MKKLFSEIPYIKGDRIVLRKITRDEIHKISVGYRLLERFWGQGIASEALALMIDYLYNETDIEIITASTMIENRASARVLEKNGFDQVVHAVPEDWGFAEPATADKWIR